MVTRLVLLAGTASTAACTVRYRPVPSAATVGVPPAGLDDADGVGDGRGDADGVGDADRVAVGLGDAGAPVHATPLRAKAVGAGLAVVQVPLKPKPALPPVGIAAL